MFAKGKPSHIEHVYLVRSSHVSNATKLGLHFDSCTFLKQYLFTNVFTVFVYKYSHNMLFQIFSQYLFTNICLVFVYEYSPSICLRIISQYLFTNVVNVQWGLKVLTALLSWAGRQATHPAIANILTVLVHKYSDNICYKQIFLQSTPL